MALLAKLSRLLCRSSLGFCFTLILLSGCAILLINYFFKPVETGVVNLNVQGKRIHNIPGGHHRKGQRKHRHKEESEEEAFLQICKVPKLSFFRKSHKEIYHSLPPLTCPGKDIFYLKDHILHLNPAVEQTKNINKCMYRAIGWFNDTHHIYSKEVTKSSKFEVKIKHDFFRVHCFVSQTEHEKISGRHLLSEKPEDEVQHKVHEGPHLVGSMGIPDPIILKKKKKSEVKNISDKQNAKQKIDQDEHVIDSIKNKGKKTLMNENVLNEKDENVETYDEQQLEKNIFGENQAKDKMNDNVVDSLDGLPDFDQFFVQVYPKKLLQREKEPQTSESLNVNVLLLVVESMSHLALSHKLPKTQRFLTNDLSGKVMNGYSIVGDGSSGSLLPLLTGKPEKELPAAGLNQEGATYVDSFDLIFNDYDNKGYVTLYAEDMPDIGTFNFNYNGFEQEPVDHYMRPFWIAADQSDVNKNSPKFCLGSQPKHSYTINYVKDFFEKYQDIPKFGLMFLGEISHKDSNRMGYLDDDLYKFLKVLKETGRLDNTVIIAMGDHGPRHHRVRRTIQGKLEERLPALIISLPKLFHDSYEQLEKNLKENTEKLITPYDVYETLKDFLDKGRWKMPLDETARGISLLKQIPLTRTCESAGISLHWCTCLMYEEVSIENKEIQQAAVELVNYINQLTLPQRRLCAKLSLSHITDANLIQPNEKLLEFIEKHKPESVIANFSQHVEMKVKNYQIIITTNPNKAVYEGTVQYSVDQGTFVVLPDISRLTLYENEPKCILKTYPYLRNFCYCTDQKQTKNLVKEDL